MGSGEVVGDVGSAGSDGVVSGEVVVRWLAPGAGRRRERILEGWHVEDGTWDRSCVAGVVLQGVRRGLGRRQAGLVGGLLPGVVDEWCARGGEHVVSGEGGFDRGGLALEVLPYADFLVAVVRNEALFEAELVGSVMAGALKDGRLALEVLSRRFPARWRGVGGEEGGVPGRSRGVLAALGDPNVAADLAALARRVDELGG